MRKGNLKKKRSSRRVKNTPGFDVRVFLDSNGLARTVREFAETDVVFSQGDAAQTVLFLQSGSVKLSVISDVGKEAIVAILGPGDFFGEGCLAGQPIRMGNATAISKSTVLFVDKKEMLAKRSQKWRCACGSW